MADERTKRKVYYLSHRTRYRLFMARSDSGLTRYRNQIEYRINGEWLPVVGSDHNPEGKYGHDITAEGVHLDVYRDGEKVSQERLMGSTDPETALNIAEMHMKEHRDALVRRFEQWHKDRIQPI